MRANMLAIQKSFSQAVPSYDRAARVQAKAAEILGEKLLAATSSSQPTSVWEIGCGTGILSERLASLLPEHRLVVSDPSEEMLSACRKRLERKDLTDPRITYRCANAENLIENDAFPVEQFQIVASSFAMQWFLDFEGAMSKLLSRLPLQSQIIFAIPIEGSFKEWRRAASICQVPCTANTLPAVETLRSVTGKARVDLEFEVRDLTAHYPDSLKFFQSIREFGAATQLDEKSLSRADLLRLMNTWDLLGQGSDRAIEVTYRVLFGRFSK